MTSDPAGGDVPRKTSSLAVRADSWKPLKGIALHLSQLGALTKKNILIRRRAWKTNLLLIAQAALFIVLTWGVDQAMRASNQRRPAFSSVPTAIPQQVAQIPDCADNMFMRRDEPCYTLLYAPQGSPVIDGIVSAVAARNFPPIPRNHIKGFENGSLIDDYLLTHPNTVIAAVEFVLDGPESIGFSVQTNSSVQWFKGKFQDPNMYAQLPVQVAVEREIVRALAQRPALQWTVDVTQFPHPSAKSPSAVAKFAPTFLFASIMFQFVLQLHDILHEKESGVRRLMKVMGLRDFPFWASWVLFQSFLAVIEACLLVGFSFLFKFQLFTKNDFRLSFMLILEVSLAMTSFGFFVASFLRKAGAAVPVGFLLFVIAWVFLIVIGFGFPYTPKYSALARFAFNTVPWTLLAKGIGDLAAASDGRYGGLQWDDRATYCQIDTPPPAMQQEMTYWQVDCVTPLSEIYVILGLQIVVYFLLAICVDKLMDDAGVRLSWPWKRDGVRRAQEALKSLKDSELPTADADVVAEQEKMQARCEAYVSRTPATSSTEAYAVQMFGLRKTYKRSSLFSRKKPFVAVDGNWLGIQEGECFCLLGPNGAGKTTTIHCLTGVLPFSEGDALVNATSIATARGLDKIRPLMGVCPQFDTGLWDLLTGREHLRLFASIKGMPSSARAPEAVKLLEDVKLTEAADMTAGAYSGGMKRRLSVAMALLGDPKIVYLDEPTTGLDPISRRHLWDLVDKAKQDRAVILTTHSMEEADILGDRIGIMVRGRLRCVGTSLRLKSRFGSGYRISIRVRKSLDDLIKEDAPVLDLAEEKTRIKALFTHRLGVQSIDESLDYIHFLVPYEHEDRLPFMLAHLKSHADELCVADVQMRLTPLEEVFLNVTRKAELEHAEAEGQYETLVLAEENIAIQVPVGAEFIQSPNGNFYHIKWIQNDSGALVMQDYYKDPLSTVAATVTGPVKNS